MTSVRWNTNDAGLSAAVAHYMSEVTRSRRRWTLSIDGRWSREERKLCQYRRSGVRGE